MLAMTRAGLIMSALAALVLVLVTLWGIAIYPQLPATIPVHWNAAGEADRFSDRTITSAFAPLFIGALLFSTMLLSQLLLRDRPWLVPAEQAAYSTGLGYVNLSVSVLVSWGAVSSWFDLQVGPLFLVLSIMSGLPVLIIIGLHLPAIREQRRALEGPEEPSMDPRYWVWGGMFYRNPDDPRAVVPRPPHLGTGGTFNLGSRGGLRLAWLTGALLLALMLLPFVLALVNS